MKAFEGYMTALVTPFSEDGGLDRRAFRHLVRRQKAAGIRGLLVAGTTGESPVLSLEERSMLLEDAIGEAQNTLHIMANIGTNNTAKSVELAKHAEKSGVHSLLAVTPYYNRPTQEGMYRHFMEIAEAANLPLWLYDVPGRTGSRIEPETVRRLARHPNIAGIKDATGDLARPAIFHQLAGEDFGNLGGEDALALPYFAAGGDGCISVSSNVAPEFCVRMYNCWRKGNILEAQKLHRMLFPLHKAMFMESSPSPAKAALSELGLITEKLRLPLVEVKKSSKQVIRDVLTELNLFRQDFSE